MYVGVYKICHSEFKQLTESTAVCCVVSVPHILTVWEWSQYVPCSLSLKSFQPFEAEWVCSSLRAFAALFPLWWVPTPTIQGPLQALPRVAPFSEGCPDLWTGIPTEISSSTYCICPPFALFFVRTYNFLTHYEHVFIMFMEYFCSNISYTKQLLS